MHTPLGAGLALALAPIAGAATITIDDFSTGWPDTPETPFGYLSSDDPGDLQWTIDQDGTVAGAIDDSRYTLYTSGAATGGNSAMIAGGHLNISAGPGDPGGDVSLTYGFNRDLNTRFDQLGSDFFAFDIAGDFAATPSGGVSARPISFSLLLVSAAGTASEASYTFVQDLDQTGTHQIDLSTFAAQGVDLTDIDRLTVRFDASAYAAVDFSVSNLHVVSVNPVPSPAGGLSIAALAGLAALRRCRHG
ncbi:MAG: hypothetical protein AAGI30_01960 [Planctomycetota bacterium]